ncbi:hypothetical protein B8W66_02600 [Mycobacterium decipiens]|uniref:Uncharacterized protein n=1 Tax=Mycobacterium decipiens TaxID=1430326 RepID=A0A1X2LYT6_9MYCO|nr:hypothetical protein B8W66_02600 [Mycobacterium decipiens]
MSSDIRVGIITDVEEFWFPRFRATQYLVKPILVFNKSNTQRLRLTTVVAQCYSHHIVIYWTGYLEAARYIIG